MGLLRGSPNEAGRYRSTLPPLKQHSRELWRRAALAWGVGLIALLFLIETAVAHHSRPSAASPWIWSVLGIVAALGFARGAWLSLQARRHQEGEPSP